MEIESKNSKTLIVRIYKDGKDTGKTEVLDLTDPTVVKGIQKSMHDQDGGFD